MYAFPLAHATGGDEAWGMKRKHHTRSEISTWLHRYEKSGLSVRIFTQRHGLAESTFYKWLRAYAHKSPSPTKPEVVELPAPITHAGFNCELAWPDGRRLQFPADLSPNVLRRLLGALEKPT